MALAAACSDDAKPQAAPTQPSSATSAPATATATVAPTRTPARTVTSDGYTAEPAFPHVDFAKMLGMQVVPGSANIALVVSQDGVIRRADLRDAASTPAVFLDIGDRLIRDPGMEEGLLGLAFAPDYASSGEFYVYYSAGSPRRAVLSRFVAQDDAADPASERVLLEIEEPYSNHNGGSLAFGPDGYLYIGVGDGGAGGDPHGNGQNKDALLGKILRIDVSGEDYTVPADNPFARGGGRGEIWAYGLRNPWRLNFDPQTGALWAADVGQGDWEEIDRIVKGGNYGWNVMEGDHCFEPASGCHKAGLLPPRAEYGHDLGCSVTGGYVYRGPAMPELDGWYVYGDYCSGRVWAVNTADGASAPVQLANTGATITSFAQDAAGELYLVTFDQGIRKLTRK
ncbi:MAG: PQQ-dependent sugar dehydrogenase [Chloroflexi bacterium]|nr:PQQ-dependent sugar dehydrogenase [Chloroflexota bacterium]